MTSTLPTYVQALLDPAAYPERPGTVEFVQTHISYVFLAGASVYKVKKPVNFGFLDFSTLELRRHWCLEEVRLNRRLSPDVYLGVVPVTEQGGLAALAGAGRVIDWAVHMRRLPQERMLERLIATDAVPDATALELGEAVGRFHLAAGRGERITALGGRVTAVENWRENFAQAHPFRGNTLAMEDDDAIQTYVAGFLQREESLLAARDAEGYIRDLHGDLRSAQIWALEQPPEPPEHLTSAERALLGDLGGIRILDCIEFNERLRFCDTASDAAFLAMDFAFRYRQDLADQFLGRYLEVTGDTRLPLLLDFYRCYRAYVRGKVESLALTEREIGARQRRLLARRAGRFFRLSARYTSRSPEPRLIAMMGISGSGKSYLARQLACRIGAVWLSSDLIRKQLAGLQPTSRAGAEIYSPVRTSQTYAALCDGARDELASGHPVILDATFLLASQRRPAADLADQMGVPFLVIWCRARPEILESRLRERADDAWRVSDADADVAHGQIASLEPPNELRSVQVTRVDTGQSLPLLLRRLERRLAQGG